MSESQTTYLEFSDGEAGSHKFYEVTVVGATVTTRFGRIGTAGQTMVDYYPSPQEAALAAEKKISEKLNKGYEAATQGTRAKRPVPRRLRPTVEEQLKTLAECGIALKTELGTDALFSDYRPDDYVEDPYMLLLLVLGGETEEEPYGYISSDIWHFDTECVEDHGDYARIALRIGELAGGDLPLEGIEDYVDVEGGRAWLAFRLDGRDYKWDLEVDNDWVDTRIFSEFEALLRARHPAKRYTYLDLGGGQDCLIGCSTPEQLEKLKTSTRLNFRWLVE